MVRHGKKGAFSAYDAGGSGGQYACGFGSCTTGAFFSRAAAGKREKKVFCFARMIKKFHEAKK
jgi:hypothetical protein